MEHRHFKKAFDSHKLLAQERTIMANERNTLAYIRTGFSSLVLGIALIELFTKDLIFIYGGWLAVVVGLALILFGLIYYPIRKKKIKSY